MFRLLCHWVIVAGSFLLVSHLLPGFHVASFGTALLVSVVYGVLIVLASILLFPFAWTLFIFVPRPIWKLLCLVFVNSLLLLACTHLVRGFRILGYEQAALAAVLLAVITGVLDHLLRDTA